MVPDIMAERSKVELVAGAEAPTCPDPLEIRIRELLSVGNMRQAATEVIRGYGPHLLQFLRGLLGNEAEAEEAFARTSERIWRGLPEFRGEAAPRTWCFRLAWSAAADLRKEAWGRRRRRLETGEAAELAAAEGTATWLRHERLRLSLQALRAGLDLEEQGLLQLRIDQRLSWGECAEVLAIAGAAPSAETLMKRFERIKSKLKVLAEAGEAT
jgi:RNA polymerase sigma-70 factor (ECF subfamily)